MEKKPILQVKDLKTYFHSEDGMIKAVDGVSFEVYPGETLGIVGESGCGKSVTSLTVMRLLDKNGRIAGGEILFEGKDILKIPESKMMKIRGNDMAMIFQEPMTSLNPVYTIGFQITEAILLHQDVGKSEAKRQAIDMLRKVGIPEPEKRVDQYPHELSGGMRQRAMIAMALCCNPKLLFADEPTTALDVTIQAQILELVIRLQEDFGMAVVFITHDLGVIAETAQRVVVMYAGKVVEHADVTTLFKNPRHPYTWGLMNAIPSIDVSKDVLYNIPGVVPDPLSFPDGCRFRTRCPLASEQCTKDEPPLEEIEEGHKSACWHIDKLIDEISVSRAGESA